MAEAETGRMSAVRAEHEAHPRRRRRASKPGAPAPASDKRDDEQSDERNDKQSETEGASRLLPRPHLSVWTRLAMKLLGRLARHELKKLVGGGGGPLGKAVEALSNHGEALANSGEALAKPAAALAKPAAALAKPAAALEKRGDGLALGDLRPALPMQEAVDIAVPLKFAWERWMELEFLPEGVDRVVEIERDGSELRGRLDGAQRDWRAEILDEREQESFAWQSTQGSDCAGLVTFHSLSARLTRLELTLDVVPCGLGDAAVLLSHLAHARARRDLRRLKAELELVSPDVYARDEATSSR